MEEQRKRFAEMLEGGKKEPDMKQKIAGFVIGVLVVVGVLCLVKWAMGSKNGVVGGASAHDNTAFGDVAFTAQPCMAPPLPTVACGCGPNEEVVNNPNIPSRNDLYPGSYVTFGLYNTGCNGDVRNKRC